MAENELLEIQRDLFKRHQDFQRNHEKWLWEVEHTVNLVAANMLEVSAAQKRTAEALDRTAANLDRLTLIVLRMDTGGKFA